MSYIDPLVFQYVRQQFGQHIKNKYHTDLVMQTALNITVCLCPKTMQAAKIHVYVSRTSPPLRYQSRSACRWSLFSSECRTWAWKSLADSRRSHSNRDDTNRSTQREKKTKLIDLSSPQIGNNRDATANWLMTTNKIDVLLTGRKFNNGFVSSTSECTIPKCYVMLRTTLFCVEVITEKTT